MMMEIQRKRFEDATLLALQVEEGTHEPKVSVALEARKVREVDAFLEFPEGTQPCRPVLEF